ncbi:MAG: DUF2207 domain-containing protein [Gammaproteobacteria bacterium]
MKRTFSLWGIFLLFLAFPAAAVEEILSFHSDIQVNPDGSMVVTETIRVRAEGREIKRGIYRDFPTDYKDRFGNRYRVGFEVRQVLRDGRAESYHTRPQGNGVRVYIGHKDRFLRPGEYTYTLTYRTDRQLGFFDDHDELYWNVTGNGWLFPIREATAVVRLPGTVPPESPRPEAYTGPQGARGQDYESYVDYDGTVRFKTTRRLGSREGLTIVVAWPKGHVHEPTTEERIGYLLEDNRALLVGALGLTIVLIYYWLIWWRLGRDPEAGVIIPRYTPPEGYSPASMRFIRKMGYDHKTFAAALVNLAVKGMVEITDDGREYTLFRTDKAAEGLAPGERVLLRLLFGKPARGSHRKLKAYLKEAKQGSNRFRLTPRSLLGALLNKTDFERLKQHLEALNEQGVLSDDATGMVVLEKRNHALINGALTAHKNSLKNDYDKIYFNTHRGWLVPGILLSVATLVIAAFAQDNEEQLAVGLFMSLWLSGWTVGVVLLFRRVWDAWRGMRSLLEAGGALFITAFALPFFAGEAFGLFILFSEAGPAIPFVLVAALLINLLFFQLMKAPTRAGRELLDKVEGFRQYLEVAEKDEMNFRNPPEKTPELFERYLPYALALDVEQQWAERFAGLFHRLEQEGAAYRPGWYRGSHWNSADLSGFSSAVGSSLGSAIASSSTAPGSSSGSGGGGSSGGGGGGGGGGGW